MTPTSIERNQKSVAITRLKANAAQIASLAQKKKPLNNKYKKINTYVCMYVSTNIIIENKQQREKEKDFHTTKTQLLTAATSEACKLVFGLALAIGKPP